MPRFVPVLAVVFVVACGGNAAPQKSAATKDTITQRQRDSFGKGCIKQTRQV